MTLDDDPGKCDSSSILQNYITDISLYYKCFNLHVVLKFDQVLI